MLRGCIAHQTEMCLLGENSIRKKAYLLHSFWIPRLPLQITFAIFESVELTEITLYDNTWEIISNFWKFHQTIENAWTHTDEQEQ